MHATRIHRDACEMQQAAVRDHHALGMPCGARGIDQHGHLVRQRFGLALAGLVDGAGHQRAQAGGSDLAGTVANAVPQGVRRCGVGEQHQPRMAVSTNLLDLARRQPGVDDHGPGAQFRQCEHQRDHCQAVLRDDQHTVAGAGALGLQVALRGFDAVPQLCKSDGAAVLEDGHVPRGLGGPVSWDVANPFVVVRSGGISRDSWCWVKRPFEAVWQGERCQCMWAASALQSRIGKGGFPCFRMGLACCRRHQASCCSGQCGTNVGAREVAMAARPVPSRPIACSDRPNQS